jgi:bacillopeptidase F (M6 metalloprotease family)
MTRRGLIAGLLLVLVAATHSYADSEKILWQSGIETGRSLLAANDVCIDNEKIIYQFGFETGQGDWEIDNGIWELCIHGTTVPPGGGSLYFATICDGNYPSTADSRLISPPIDLPAPETLIGDEELHLRFWHKFSYASGDYGQVQISVYDAVTGWSPWNPIGTVLGNDISGVWSPTIIDLTEYAGEMVRIAFYHYTNNDIYTSSGWSIDNIQVIKEVPEYDGDFECGWFDWSASNGVWEVGAPTAGPSACYSGTQCAGTVLGGTYPGNTDSSLISPSFWLDTVAGGEELHLRFWHWFSYGSGDYGQVKISSYDAVAGWSPWEPIGTVFGNDISGVWSPASIDISEYAGKKIRIAFYHYTNNDIYASWGWYIDDIQVIKKVPEWDGDFECGWFDWSASNGVWEVGVPTAGLCACYSGTQCAGTVLGGSYPTSTDSLLISPSFTVPTIGNALLSFRHWYNMHSSDYGKVQISVHDAVTGWSSWSDLTAPITGVSGGWTKHPDIPLISYAGQKVRLGFALITNNDIYSGYGWFIDHIRITSFPHFCECDLNQDGKCNILDYQRFIQDWGSTDCGTPPGTGCTPNDCECDLNHDGKCNILDYQRFIEDWGNVSCTFCP